MKSFERSLRIAHTMKYGGALIALASVPGYWRGESIDSTPLKICSVIAGVAGYVTSWLGYRHEDKTYMRGDDRIVYGDTAYLEEQFEFPVSLKILDTQQTPEMPTIDASTCTPADLDDVLRRLGAETNFQNPSNN